jgi:hypothetical protein
MADLLAFFGLLVGCFVFAALLMFCLGPPRR